MKYFKELTFNNDHKIKQMCRMVSYAIQQVRLGAKKDIDVNRLLTQGVLEEIYPLHDGLHKRDKDDVEKYKQTNFYEHPKGLQILIDCQKISLSGKLKFLKGLFKNYFISRHISIYIKQFVKVTNQIPLVIFLI